LAQAKNGRGKVVSNVKKIIDIYITKKITDTSIIYF